VIFWSIVPHPFIYATAPSPLQASSVRQALKILAEETRSAEINSST